MKKLLILFAKGFPYGTGEPFLESEAPFYREHFHRVLLVTPCKKGERPTRTVGENIEILEDHTQSGHLPSLVLGFGRMLTDRMFYRELGHLIRRRLLSPKRLASVMLWAMCANNRAAMAHKWLKRHPEYDRAVAYSYWMYVPAYGAVRLKQRTGGAVPAMTRAHGFDVYLQRHSREYLPYHGQLYDRLDEIAVISENGKQALEGRYGAVGKVRVCHLGAWDRKGENPTVDRQVFRIVTCARTIPLKRLHRLVDALCLMTDRPIHWTHIGSGPSQESLEAYAREKLPENVTAEFAGFVPNSQIYDRYGREPYHVFVNISETEGVPVSIMEAMSFHIPVIATAVGGTPELIEEGSSGYLLPESFSDELLAQRLRQLMELPDGEYLAMRRQAREKFREEFSAQTNYQKFVAHLAEDLC